MKFLSENSHSRLAAYFLFQVSVQKVGVPSIGTAINNSSIQMRAYYS